MKGVIIHGGHGTRLRPLTHTGPKQLLPIANKPMSQFCLEAISETGITDIAIVIGGVGSNKVREYYGNGEKLSFLITNFLKVRKKTSELVSKLEPEDMIVQSNDFVSPIKWHLGHTTWFFENFILQKKKIIKNLISPLILFLIRTTMV